MPTHRQAYAAVRNDTSQPIYAVGLAHKYSDNYKNAGQWGIIQPGHLSGPVLVDYNTGFLTTGRDWWKVTWSTQDQSGRTLHYSDPENFRDIIDWLEKLGPDVISSVAGAVAAIATAESGPGAVVAAAGAAAAAKILTDAFLNTEGTAGFKQHILTDEDENATAQIIIHEDTTITIRSNSGTSETISSKHKL
ncbi:hypothetical protein N7478_010184 [Penicillium angulare]|uniref:uncharacterized protein n=1 Tax=Penicillium angulare TaxID=116970 RepID=UPI00253FA911|nr:uncharacterized protein N7478_010184 [Penicillium angulare]KAJ5267376.1 hypothetical protein N7478_010184 [Penicillium angulare]